jgi:hypothetical protein
VPAHRQKKLIDKFVNGQKGKKKSSGSQRPAIFPKKSKPDRE